jgi:hypothetical protein
MIVVVADEVVSVELDVEAKEENILLKNIISKF